MASKIINRSIIIPTAFIRSFFRKPYNDGSKYNKILIAHHLLLGDTILLTPLLAKIHELYSNAEIFLLVAPHLVPLYKMRPFGVHTLPYHPRKPSLLLSCIINGTYDIAIVPGDNRYSWLARAMGSKTIITLSGDGEKWKDWQSDHFIDWPKNESTLADIFSSLIPGKTKQIFKTSDWPLSKPKTFTRPNFPYYIFHISSRNPLRRWPSKYWRRLADVIKQHHNINLVWSTGPNERYLLDDINILEDEYSYCGTLDLLQLTHLIKDSEMLISVETGISHLCRITGTKSVIIYGQGNRAIHGTEKYWEITSPQFQIFNADITCRNIRTLFGRRLQWVNRCDRNTDECANPICITGINPDIVYNVIVTNSQTYR